MTDKTETIARRFTIRVQTDSQGQTAYSLASAHSSEALAAIERSDHIEVDLLAHDHASAVQEAARMCQVSVRRCRVLSPLRPDVGTQRPSHRDPKEGRGRVSYMFVIGSCCSCGTRLSFNAEKVPSLRLNGVREPLCAVCFDRWNEIHRVSKGLEPLSLDPDAYEPQKVRQR